MRGGAQLAAARTQQSAQMARRSIQKANTVQLLSRINSARNTLLIAIYKTQAGEECTETLAALAWTFGLGVSVAFAHTQQGRHGRWLGWLRLGHEGLKAVKSMSLAGYTWSPEHLKAIDDAVIATVDASCADIQASLVMRGMADYLSSRIRSHELTDDDINELPPELQRKD